MSNSTRKSFLYEELCNFTRGPRCCQVLSASFSENDRILLCQEASYLGLVCAPIVSNGIHHLKIMKSSCMHGVQVPFELQISPLVENEAINLLRQTSNVNDAQISTNIFAIPNVSNKPEVPPHRFAIGPLAQSIIRKPLADLSRREFMTKLLPYKNQLLQTIENNRVVVVNGGASFEKASALPVFLMEKSSKQKQHCKIICVQRKQLLAIFNSERLAQYLCEKVGTTIAYQVHLQSRISESSNLIYTTASFLMRVLMGQQITNSFRHISHVLIDDVHLHEAYTDILLSTVRDALHYYEHLRIILLSNSHCNARFLQYFGEGEEIRLNEQNIYNPQIISNIYYAEDIRQIVEPLQESDLTKAYEALSYEDLDSDGGINSQVYLDRCLDTYAIYGTDQPLEAFLYMVHGEYASINYRHSQTGITAALIASKLGRADHLRRLLDLYADPYITDEYGKNIFYYMGNDENVERHYAYSIDANPTLTDVAVIVDLVRVLMMSDNWLPGGILIFVPCLTQISRVYFSLLRHKIIGDLPGDLAVYMLHSDIEKTQLELLLESCKRVANCRSVVIATDIAESIGLWTGIRYVIDSGRSRSMVYHPATYSTNEKYEIISRQQLQNRYDVLSNLPDSLGVCFRLIPKWLVAKLPMINRPALETMPLDRICLTVKLLSPGSMVAEFFQSCINKPSFRSIYHAVDELKQIGVFDELEDVTWLGCRLIDVPITCRFGKMLIYGILLQCLDPVLTIVSCLSSFDPLSLPGALESMLQPHIPIERTKKKQERKRLSQGFSSDHFVFIRLYQEWQNELREENASVALVDEHHFVFNCLMERISDMRTQLVGSLRSSQLIHNQGLLAMHPVNTKAHCWALIKAVLVSGLYPGICMFDQRARRLKSGRQQELIVHPSSVLRELDVPPAESIAMKLNSPWIVYTTETDSGCFNSINHCTIIAPLAVAIFAGKHTPLNILCRDNDGETVVDFFVDNWISFRMTNREMQFVSKIREQILNIFATYVQNCGNPDFSKRSHAICSNMPNLCNILEKLLNQEDLSLGFYPPENVGLRPKAVPNRFLQKFENTMAQSQIQLDLVQWRNRLPDLHFFIIQSTDLNDVNNCCVKYNREHFQSPINRAVHPFLEHGTLVFAMLYNPAPDLFHTVAKFDVTVDNHLLLRECFKNKIFMYEVMSTCVRGNIACPSIDQRRMIFKLDSRIGMVLLRMFAFRNNYLHTNYDAGNV